MLPALIPLYFIGSLKGSIFDFGVMSALASLFSILTSIYAGQLPERFGKAKPFILFSFLLSSIVLFFLTRVTDILLFQALYILLKVFDSIHFTSTRIFIAETYQKEDWNKMFARYGLIVSLANTMGLAICSLLVSSIGYKMLLFICAPLVLISFFMAIIFVNDPPIFMERWLSRISRPIDDLESLSYSLGSSSSVKRFGLKSTIKMSLFGIGTLIFAMATSSGFSSLPIFFRTVTAMEPSTIFAVFWGRELFRTFSFVVVGRWGSGWGGDAIKIATISRAVLVLLLPFVVFLPLLVPIVAILVLSALAFCRSLYSIGRSTVIMNYAPEGSVGVYEAFPMIGEVIGQLLSGLIPAIFGFNLLFMLASTLFFVAGLIFWKSRS